MRYWFSDGLPEIGLAAGFFFTGLFLLSLHPSHGFWWNFCSLPAASLLVSIICPLAILLTRRVLWPHQPPYAIYRASLTAQIGGAVIMIPPLVALAWLTSRLSEELLSSSARYELNMAVGLMFCFIPLFLGFSSGALRFYLLALPMLWLAGFAAYNQFTFGATLVLLWFGSGGLFFCSGIFALGRFWRQPLQDVLPEKNKDVR